MICSFLLLIEKPATERLLKMASARRQTPRRGRFYNILQMLKQIVYCARTKTAVWYVKTYYMPLRRRSARRRRKKEGA